MGGGSEHSYVCDPDTMTITALGGSIGKSLVDICLCVESWSIFKLGALDEHLIINHFLCVHYVEQVITLTVEESSSIGELRLKQDCYHFHTICSYFCFFQCQVFVANWEHGNLAHASSSQNDTLCPSAAQSRC